MLPLQRPMSAYFFFLADMRGKVKADQPDIKVIGAERHLSSACLLGLFPTTPALLP